MHFLSRSKKNTFCGVLVLFALFSVLFSQSTLAQVSDDALDKEIGTVSGYLFQTVPQPQVSSVGGEWAVFGISRAGLGSADYFDSYRSALRAKLRATGGILHTRKYTEYARVALTLTALGENPTDFAGFDVISPLTDTKKVLFQGTAGAVWALLALDSGSYGDNGAREIYLSEILNAVQADGGFAITSGSSDADMTAMALNALAPYRSTHKNVQTAVDNAFAYLSSCQNADGSYSSNGISNVESTAQVLTALCTYGISETDSRFVKNGRTALDALLAFRSSDGGFRHTSDETAANAMATEQGFYALAAVWRRREGKNALFQLSDASENKNAVSGVGKAAVGLPGKNAAVMPNAIKYPGRTFADIASHPSRRHIEALAARGVINGKSELLFDPESGVTRAEFCAMAVRALGLQLTGTQSSVFTDVTDADWFAPYVRAAYAFGLVNGVSETEFAPNGSITREQAAVMIARAAGLCGLDTSLSESGVRDALSVFTDYRQVSEYAKNAMAFCLSNGILDIQTAALVPQEPETRAELADGLFGLLNLADLL